MPLKANLYCQKHLTVQLFLLYMYRFKASSWWGLRSCKQYIGVLQIFTSRSLNHPKKEKIVLPKKALEERVPPSRGKLYAHLCLAKVSPMQAALCIGGLKGVSISTIPKQTILGFARNLMKGKPVFYEISTVAVSFLKASSSIFFVNWLKNSTTSLHL